jgi:3-methyladenine DNA glycosylase Tag
MNENKQKWSIMLLKQKQFQEVFTDFTGRVANLIDREVAKNRQ